MGLEQYSSVANCRRQRETLQWQVPITALTGEAFLFMISIGASTFPAGRIVASILALTMAVASLHSLAGHRISKLTNSIWPHEHGQDRGASEIHGWSLRDRRLRVVQEQLASESFTDRLVVRSYVFRSIQV